MALVPTKEYFYIVALLTGFVIGSSQAIARSWLSKIIPKEKRCEFFGFNGFAGKISATTGPIVFGAVSSFSGNQRLAVLTIVPFLIISFLLFLKTKEKI